ncbi:MAG TPA: hypothetical protein VKG80_19835 [Trebonia sp.]|nr:hypothetical protein [Trebonia sp.]
MLRLMMLRRLEASVPVMMCGYRNSARAEPSARLAKSSWVLPSACGVGINVPFGFLVSGLIAAKCVCAVPKMWPQPPSLVGM